MLEGNLKFLVSIGGTGVMGKFHFCNKVGDSALCGVIVIKSSGDKILSGCENDAKLLYPDLYNAVHIFNSAGSDNIW